LIRTVTVATLGVALGILAAGLIRGPADLGEGDEPDRVASERRGRSQSEPAPSDRGRPTVPADRSEAPSSAAIAPEEPEEPEAPSDLERFRRSRIRIRFENASIEEVLDRMSERTGVAIELDAAAAERLRQEDARVDFAWFVPVSALRLLDLPCRQWGLEVVDVSGRVVVRDRRQAEK